MSNSLFPVAHMALSSELRAAELGVQHAQLRLMEAIEDEKRAHSKVGYWQEQLDEAVARRVELEGALRKLCV